MTDLFSKDGPEGPVFGIAVDQTGPDAVGPPSWLLFGLLAELIATILCFLPATRPIHMVG